MPAPTQWRLIVALAPYGGLRCPSELPSLTSEDINWEASRITVTSNKTKHHGNGTRFIPMFPEHRPYLDDAQSLSVGQLQIITRYRNNTVNVRTQLLRILKRASVKPWER